MGGEEPTKSETTVDAPLPPLPAPEAVKAKEKSANPPTEFKSDDSKYLSVVEKKPDPLAEQKISGGSLDRDVALAKVEKEKQLAFIKAWEDSEKTKAENKAQKKAADVTSWENSKRADLEAKLKKIEEEFEKKKADYAEKMKNEIALIHKQAEEKRAIVEAERSEALLKVAETVGKCVATQKLPPSQTCGCIGG